MKKYRFALILIAFFLVTASFSIWIYYDTHSTPQKALGAEVNPTELIDFHKGKVALVDTGTKLKAVYLKHHSLGWKKELENGPILKEADKYRELFSFFDRDGYTFIYGYDPTRQIARVTFKQISNNTDIREVSHKRFDQPYWYLIVPASVNQITPDNLTITSTGGKNISYPFTELDLFLH